MLAAMSLKCFREKGVKRINYTLHIHELHVKIKEKSTQICIKKYRHIFSTIYKVNVWIKCMKNFSQWQ